MKKAKKRKKQRGQYCLLAVLCAWNAFLRRIGPTDGRTDGNMSNKERTRAQSEVSRGRMKTFSKLLKKVIIKSSIDLKAQWNNPVERSGGVNLMSERCKQMRKGANK